MHQDIANSDMNCSSLGYDLVHNVNVCEDSIIGKMYGTEFAVNSFHHRAIKEFGEGFKIVATSGEILKVLRFS